MVALSTSSFNCYSQCPGVDMLQRITDSLGWDGLDDSPPSLLDALLEHTDRSKPGCWQWTGRTIPHGYGMFSLRGETWFAHRAAFYLFVGRLRRKRVIDPLCRNRACVNPQHLEQVTYAENARRGVGIGRPRLVGGLCPYGHEMTPENTAHYTYSETGHTRRRCRSCYRRGGVHYRG